MKVLLTGAGGFLGSATAKELEEKGHEVSGLGLTGRGGWPAIDLTDPVAALRAVVEAAPEAVIHLAGESSPVASESDPAGTFQANVTTTWNLLEAVSLEAPEAFFVLGSSATVYGRPDDGTARRIPEGAPVEPISIYGASKAAAEMVTGGYAASSRPAVAILRIFNLVGPGQNTGVAADLVEAAREGLDVFSAIRNPGAQRDFTDVRDAARAIAMVSETETAGTFNLCSGSAVSTLELARMVEEAAGPGTDRSAGPEQDSVAGDPTRLIGAIGWEPVIPLAEGIRAMIAHRN